MKLFFWTKDEWGRVLDECKDEDSEFFNEALSDRIKRAVKGSKADDEVEIHLTAVEQAAVEPIARKLHLAIPDDVDRKAREQAVADEAVAREQRIRAAAIAEDEKQQAKLAAA